MRRPDEDIAILKSLWSRVDGRWGIHDMKSLALKRQAGSDPDFFTFESEMELLTQSPGSRNIHEIFASFGPTDFLLKQSVVPVVAWVEGEHSIRCIGTAFVISCSGYVMTACHVLLDPKDRDYGKVVRKGNTVEFSGLSMGVFIPVSPAYGLKGFTFLPFEYSWYWGEWKNPPLSPKSFTALRTLRFAGFQKCPAARPTSP